MHARNGMPVDSTDGPWGELDDFVVDPTNWQLTHLVVQPHRHHDRSHLVPITSVTSCGDRLALALSAEDIDKTPKVEVTEFVTIDRPDRLANGWTTDAAAVSAWPYYPYVGPAVSLSGRSFLPGFSGGYDGPRYVATVFDHVPDQEVEIRRSSQVVSSDEHNVGVVDGFVFDEDGSITHVVLERGHMWAHREITIPISHVRHADRDRVRLDVTRHEIGEFPAVKFHRGPKSTT